MTGALGVSGAEEGQDVIYTLKDLSGCFWRVKRDDACEFLSTTLGTQQHFQLLAISIVKR